jgi:pantetheine-phosphate adenylyltransferase
MEQYMSTGIYVGSFDPWHNGHEDILIKALKVFDKVIVLRNVHSYDGRILSLPIKYSNVRVENLKGFLVDYIRRVPLLL